METFIAIGRRLREERESMGLNQTEFAALTSSTRQTQSNYEKGERMPDALYLAAIAAAGADVGYILTGVRKIEDVPAARYAVDPRAKALVDNYMECDDEGRRVLEYTALRLCAPQPSQKKPKKG